MKRRLREIADIVGGRLIGEDEGFIVRSASIDSRKTGEGSLFFALAGTRRDGHEFVREVIEKGGAAVVSKAVNGVNKRLVMVDDVGAALRELARYERLTSGVRVVAVTGSVGKTTTKDLIAECLAYKYRVLKSEGNFNNELGLPLTLLSLDDQEVAVVEMGMRGLGQIAELSSIAFPQIAVITNLAPVHLELLGSMENIARAKCEVLDYINPGGFALVNGDIALLRHEASLHDNPVYFFGLGRDNDIILKEVNEDAGGLRLCIQVFEEEEELVVPFLSESLALNAVAAVTVARQLGVEWSSIRPAIGNFAPSGHRLRIVEINPNITLIDDCYNANPLSMSAALQVMHRHQRGRQTVAVLGDMLELGELERQAHIEVGREAAKKADRLLAVGPRGRYYAIGAIEGGMPPDHIDIFSNNGQAISFLKNRVTRDAVILIKGSRGMHMEEIVEALAGRREL